MRVCVCHYKCKLFVGNKIDSSKATPKLTGKEMKYVCSLPSKPSFTDFVAPPLPPFRQSLLLRQMTVIYYLCDTFPSRFTHNVMVAFLYPTLSDVLVLNKIFSI